MKKRCIFSAILLLTVFLSGCGIKSASVSVEDKGSLQQSSDTAPQKEAGNTESEQIEVDTAGNGDMETSEKTVPTEKEVQKKEPVMKQVKITAVGDCTLGPTQKQGYAGSFHEYYDKYGEDYFFDGVRSVFEADDFTLVNLECVLSDATERVEKTYNLKGKPEYIGILTKSSVEGVSLGNNHTFDYGQAGLDETRDILDHAGVIFGFNEHVATYKTESGIVIGIVSASQLSADEKHAGYIRDGIKKLREEGADLVIGTHPHVLQGIEIYKGKVICYSLGNFCFGGNRNPQDKNTAVFQQTFTFVDGIMQNDISADIIPYSISSTTDRNDFQPTEAKQG